MDNKTKARTPIRAGATPETASPTSCATPFSATSRWRLTVPSAAPTSSASRLRPTVPNAPTFSAPRSHSRLALLSLRPPVDYSKHTANMMKKLRIVPEEEWFPHQRVERSRLTDGRFWTVVQKDLYLALEKSASDMRWVDWASVATSTGTDVRRYFAATPGLDSLLETKDLKWADSHIRQFYATLWIHPDRSRIRFMFGDKQRELSRDDFAKYLGLSNSGARVHNLAYPNGNRDENHPPPLETIRHLYNNDDTVGELWKDHKQWNHETTVVHAIVRLSIRPRSGGLDKLTTLEIWILHLLMSAKPIDIVDLMIGEMQEIILNIRHRRLPYGPYLIHLFDKKGWVEKYMKNALDQRLERYKALKPHDKRRVKNKALQPVKPDMARKPDGRRRVKTSSLPPQVEAEYDDDDDDDDDDEHAHLDRMLSPSLEEHALVITTNEEDDPDDDTNRVPDQVLGEFRFSQHGTHDAEAGGSGCHADVPPMLQSQVDRQTAILEQIQGLLAQSESGRQQLQGQLAELQGKSESDHQQLQGQMAELQRQSESGRQQLQEQMAELQRQSESDRQQLQGQMTELQRQSESDRQQLQGHMAELQRQSESGRQQLQGQMAELQGQMAELQRQSESDRQQIQGQLAELQQQSESERQENRELRKQYSDIVALLNMDLDAICRLSRRAPLPPV